MRFDVVTLFPEWLGQLENYGVVGRAIRDQTIDCATWNPRDYTERNDGRVDDRPFGGGPGMVLQTEPLRRTLSAVADNNPGRRGPVLLMAPDGERFDQSWADALSHHDAVTLVCGRYQGIDQRFIDESVDACVSAGDFVLSGGELPAMMIVDAVSRLVPGVLGAPESNTAETFNDARLEASHYTRPHDSAVPDVLLSGDHARIARWREKQALGATWLKRPDLFEQLELNAEQQDLIVEYIAEMSAIDGASQKK